MERDPPSLRDWPPPGHLVRIGPVEFGILGPLEVRDGDALLTPAGAGLRALLTLLLLHANEQVSTDHLLDALWPDGPPPSGAGALQVRVSHLRARLGAAGRLVVTGPVGYSIEVGPGELDVDRFEELVGRADAAEAAEAALLLREALGLWRGPPLADVAYQGFAQPAIARLEELRLAALERRIEADLELGRHADLVGELDALVTEHPLRERMRSQHMLALYRSGRQAEALGSFQAARTILVDELGLEPGPVLRQLELAILRHDASLALAGTPTPDRGVLVLAYADHGFESLLPLAEPMAHKPLRELIVAWLVGSESELSAANDTLRAHQEGLAARGALARTASFTTASVAADIVRLTTEQDVALLLLAGSRSPLEETALRAVLAAAPCDVGVLVERDHELVPGARARSVRRRGARLDGDRARSLALGRTRRSAPARRAARERPRLEPPARERIARDAASVRSDRRAAARQPRRGRPHRRGCRRRARDRRAHRSLAA